MIGIYCQFKLTIMKTEKVSLRLVLVTSLGLVFGLWFASGKAYRIWISVRENGGEYGGAMDKLNRGKFQASSR